MASHEQPGGTNESGADYLAWVGGEAHSAVALKAFNREVEKMELYLNSPEPKLPVLRSFWDRIRNIKKTVEKTASEAAYWRTERTFLALKKRITDLGVELG